MHTAGQLYSLRRLDRSLSERLELVTRTGLEGAELAGFDDADPATVRDGLERTELSAMAAHVSVADLEADLEAAVRPLETVGCEQIVVPWLDADAFRSRRALEETAQRLATWAYAAGRDPVALLERYGEQILLVHLKDISGDEPCALGAGSVPLKACVDAAREAGATWLVYEHDDQSDPELALERDAETMVDCSADSTGPVLPGDQDEFVYRNTIYRDGECPRSRGEDSRSPLSDSSEERSRTACDGPHDCRPM